jgi:hypothetical protein
VFGAAQVIYTAAPLVANGAVDPLPTRLAVLPGHATVSVPPPEVFAQRAVTSQWPSVGSPYAGRYTRAALVRAADRIMHAERRHPVIVSECRGLARLVHAGLLAEAELRSVVARAALAAGKDDAVEIGSCITWGLTHPSEGAIPGAANGR